MIKQINTIREALEAIQDTHVDTHKKAIAALAEIERAMLNPVGVVSVVNGPHGTSYGGFVMVNNSMPIGSHMVFAAPPAQQAQAEAGPSGDKLSDFSAYQWWMAELEATVANGTPDQKRAVAVVRNLLKTAQAEAVPQGWPTNEMIEAGRKAALSHGPLLGNGQSLWHIFRDMYAAAPQPKEQSNGN